MEPRILPPAVIIDGEPRVLGCLPPREDFGGLPRFAVSNDLILRSDWREVDLSHLPVPVLNQGNHGSCVGHGSTSAYWFSYLLAGGTVPSSGFSPTSLYALINGGRDAGAVVSDAMDALMRHGVTTMAEVPESVIYAWQISASANATRKRFQVSEAFHCETFDAIGSALQLGFPVSFGIVIRSGFNNPGTDGLISTGGYPLGGHCMCAYGMTRSLAGGWLIRVRNSWGASWGNKGNCLLSEWHFGGQQLDAFAIRADQADPLDPNPAPVAP